MTAITQFETILLIGVIGGIIYTLATHTQAITATANGVNALYQSATASTQGQT